MPEKNLAQNDTIEIKLDSVVNGAVAAQTGAGASATAVVVLEATVNEVDWVTPLKLLDPVTKSDVANLTGPNKSGFADLPAYARARVRRTDATGGNGDTAFNAQKG